MQYVVKQITDQLMVEDMIFLWQRTLIQDIQD